MPMILYACIVRLQDGLSLSASTDFHLNQQLLECKRKLKALTLTISRQPPRGTAKVFDFNIHFCSSADISSLSICSGTFPSALAFCFLDELLWEFSASYNRMAIALATRPYPFLEFDTAIQRLKHNYNFAIDLPVQSDPSPPPVFVKLDDVEERNGLLNGYAASKPAPNCRMTPVTALGILSLTLNIMCSALSLIRGVHLAEHSWQDGYENVGRVMAFLTAFSGNVLQCYLYLFHCSARKMKACGLLGVVCLCNVYLYGLRNAWQILFHVSVALLSAHQILTRRPLDRDSGPGV
ncbi:SEC22 homolog C, vesicle trafficking protein L homeolog [Xenopus laevis]|uniref:MGC84285 protein n=1 Tax=Xenopus laevis TaxID=8355 RepID=Q66IW1_XENLA|nr:SEC22 homolog C, vesicle trafficking protein L homeolog [Xenopus laevis]AAH81166.1 MGC84285 protein [Xenopus laevis]